VEIDKRSWSVPHYLDACVAVKIFTNEEGTQEIQEYIRESSSFHFHLTGFAFYEVLSVLKRKWSNREISKAKYFQAVFVLQKYIEAEEITIDNDFQMTDAKVIVELRDIVERYNIDYSDALQIYAVINGKWKHSVQDCKTILVSADEKLVKASRDMGLRTWHFPKEPSPALN